MPRPRKGEVLMSATKTFLDFTSKFQSVLTSRHPSVLLRSSRTRLSSKLMLLAHLGTSFNPSRGKDIFMSGHLNKRGWCKCVGIQPQSAIGSRPRYAAERVFTHEGNGAEELSCLTWMQVNQGRHSTDS